MRFEIGSLKVALFFRWASAWVGVHYSKQHDAYCVCLLPFCVVRLTFVKNEHKYIHYSYIGDLAEVEKRLLVQYQ